MADLAYTFPALMWQGITRIHYDQVLHNLLPQAMPQVSSQMQ